MARLVTNICEQDYLDLKDYWKLSDKLNESKDVMNCPKIKLEKNEFSVEREGNFSRMMFYIR